MPFEKLADFRQLFEIDVVRLECAVVGRAGFRTDQRVRAAAVFGDVRCIEFLSVNDLMQVLPPLLGERKPQDLLVWII